MSKSGMSAEFEQIPQPIDHTPDADVENIYPVAGTQEVPDLESQDRATRYLGDRYQPEEGPKTRIVMAETGKTMPSIHRVPTGVKQVTRLRKVNPKEWLFNPRRGVALMLGSAVLFNAVGNADTIEKSAAYVGHKAYRIFDPLDEKTVTKNEEITRPGKIETIKVTVGMENAVGNSDVDTDAIKSFTQKVEKARASGATVRRISVRGNTSDEWGSDASIGRSNNENKVLGRERAQKVSNALRKSGILNGDVKVVRTAKEHTLTQKQKRSIERLAEAEGYMSVRSAIEAVDNKQPVSKRLKAGIKRLFTSNKNRGVTLTASVERPGKDVIETVSRDVKEMESDNIPDVPKPNFYGFIPWLPIRRRERHTKVKQTKQWHFAPSQPVLKPHVIREDSEQAWLKIRPEAIKKDGTFVEAPWAYTRKYEHLMRDDRIQDMLKADYIDAKGEERSLRVMFVDHKPAEATVETFEVLMNKFAQMEDGKVGSRISGIFVLPAESTGAGHRDPKRIGLGIDKQSDKGVLGTITYALDLVELQMPTTIEKEELLEELEAFYGVVQTAAHEVGGHGTDESDATLAVKRVHAWGIPNAHIITGEPRAHKMKPLDKVLSKLPMFASEKTEPATFDITYPVVDQEGNTVAMTARVQEGDPRLAHATTATIVGSRPTRYAGTNTAEHYAETAASVITGIETPFDEASVVVPSLTTKNGKLAKFATGFRPDTRGQQLVTDSIGAKNGMYPAVFEDPRKVTITRPALQDDTLLRKEMVRTRKVEFAREDKLVAILARISKRYGKVGN